MNKEMRERIIRKLTITEHEIGFTLHIPFDYEFNGNFEELLSKAYEHYDALSDAELQALILGSKETE